MYIASMLKRMIAELEYFPDAYVASATTRILWNSMIGYGFFSLAESPGNFRLILCRGEFECTCLCDNNFNLIAVFGYVCTPIDGHVSTMTAVAV